VGDNNDENNNEKMTMPMVLYGTAITRIHAVQLMNDYESNSKTNN